MKAHAALPDSENLQRMGEVMAGFVKEHLAQAAAKNHTQHAIEQQVVELLGRQKTGVLPDAQATEQKKLNKRHQIHQTVPAHGKRANRKGDRVELRV